MHAIQVCSVHERFPAVLCMNTGTVLIYTCVKCACDCVCALCERVCVHVCVYVCGLCACDCVLSEWIRMYECVVHRGVQTSLCK